MNQIAIRRDSSGDIVEIKVTISKDEIPNFKNAEKARKMVEAGLVDDAIYYESTCPPATTIDDIDDSSIVAFLLQHQIQEEFHEFFTYGGYDQVRKSGLGWIWDEDSKVSKNPIKLTLVVLSEEKDIVKSFN